MYSRQKQGMDKLFDLPEIVGIHVKKIPGGFVHIHRGHKDGLGNVDDLKFERESSLPEFNQKAIIFVGLPLSKIDSQKKMGKL